MLIIKWGSYHLPMTCLLHFCKLSKTYVETWTWSRDIPRKLWQRKEGQTRRRGDGRTDGGRNLKSKSCRCNFGVSGNGLSLSLSLSPSPSVVFIRPNDVSRKGRKGGFMWRTHFRCERASERAWRKRRRRSGNGWMERDDGQKSEPHAPILLIYM